MDDYFVVVDVAGESSRYELSRVVTSIGRLADNDIVLNCKGVENIHAHVILQEHGPVVKDMSRKAGVVVNDSPVTSQRLRIGDVLRIGAASLRLEIRPQLPGDSAKGVALRHLDLALSAMQSLADGEGQQDALEKLLAFAVHALGCTRGMIFEPHEGVLKPTSIYPRAADSAVSQRWSRTVVNQVVEAKKCVVLGDIDDDTEFRDQQSLRDASVRSLMAGPLRRRNGEMLGALVVDSIGAPRNFAAQDLDLFTQVVNIISLLLDNAFTLREKTTRLRHLEQEVASLKGTDLLYSSAPMEELVKKARTFAGADVTVLITGETGTGKELLARMIHASSNRNSMPFVAINCAAIPETLLESELFGHEKGAFTGATTSKLGLLRSADGGIIFLDEIGDMPLLLQGKLLRVLQEGSFIPVGTHREQRVNVRVVAATHRDLDDMVRKGLFRQDLLYRLNVAILDLPALRQRGQDAVLLARQFAARYTKKFFGESRAALQLAASAEKAILAWQWPGNVRELENRIQRAVLTCQATTISAGDLDIDTAGREALYSLKEARRRTDTSLIAKALDKSSGNLTQAASLLGIDRKVLRDLLRRYEMDNASGEQLNDGQA